jgi:prefoldin subunit 5
MIFSNFVVPLVKAVQEQQALIQSQQKTIDGLRSLQPELDRLKATVEALQQIIDSKAGK